MSPKPDATKEGVSPEEQTQLVNEARQNANGQRLEGIQELAQAARERRDADLEEAGHDVVDTTGEAENDEETIIEKAKDAAEEKTAAEEKKEETRILKVNGEEKEFSLDKILDAGTRTLQKESAADARLEEATRLLKEAQERSAQPSTDDGHSEEDRTPSSIDAENLAKILIDGDLQEVTDAVSKIVGAGRADEAATQVQNMDRSEVFNYVQDALSVNKALALFQEEPEKGGFNDLYKDETLRNMVMDAEKKLADEGDTRDYSARLADAANGVRDWRDNFIKDQGGTVAGFEKKSDKKLTADNTIEGAGGRETTNTETAPKTRAQVRKNALEKMAGSRGQQID